MSHVPGFLIGGTNQDQNHNHHQRHSSVIIIGWDPNLSETARFVKTLIIFATQHTAQPNAFLLVLLSVFASGVGADLERLAAKLTPDTASLIYCLLYPIYISYQNLQQIFC